MAARFWTQREKEKMKLDLTNMLIIAGVILVTLRFRDEIGGAVRKIPVIGGLVK